MENVQITAGSPQSVHTGAIVIADIAPSSLCFLYMHSLIPRGTVILVVEIQSYTLQTDGWEDIIRSLANIEFYLSI